MDFQKLFKELKTEILQLIKEKFDEEGQDIANDVSNFIQGSKEKIERWTLLLANQEITKPEFELLLRSQKDLIVMHALHKAGVSQIRLAHLKNSIINLVLRTVLKMIGI